MKNKQCGYCGELVKDMEDHDKVCPVYRRLKKQSMEKWVKSDDYPYSWERKKIKRREKTMKKTKDLKVKIVSKEEAYWTEIKKSTEKEIATLTRLLKFNKGILEMCVQKINKK